MSRQRTAAGRSARRMVEAMARSSRSGGGGRLADRSPTAQTDPGARALELDEGAFDPGDGGTVVVGDRPKFIAGHPVLGAIADPAAASPWEM